MKGLNQKKEDIKKREKMSVLDKIKDYGVVLLFAVSIVLGSVVYFQNSSLRKIEKQYQEEVQNTKAYEQENDSLKEQSYQFLYSIQGLIHSKDSVNRKLLGTAKELGIKEKKIKELMYLLSEAGKTDTIIFRDTIFRKDLKIDTTLQDPFYKLTLSLEYPNKVTVSPTFYQELSVIFSYKRETIQPPHKFFFVRWFQKKHEVTTVDVKERNPYVELKKSRFIDIKQK